MSSVTTNGTKELPDREFLRSIFVCVNGQLFWRRRPREHFATFRAWRVWNEQRVGRRAGYDLQTGYHCISINCVRYLEHRLVYHMEIEPLSPSDMVDHIDGNPKNGDPSNLRRCTHAQNICNQTRRPGRALPKHVWRKGKRFAVGMRANGVRHHVGTFGSLKEAESAAQRARIDLQGQFANDKVHE